MLLLGLAVVLAARLLAPGAAPPLYDSFAAPDAYRYLHAAPGQRDTPGGAAVTRAYSGQDVGPLVLATAGENPPQAQLLIGDTTLVVPPDAHAITATITAVDPPSIAPPNGVLAGNVYRFRIVTDTAQAVTLRPEHPVSLVLRGPNGTTGATIDVFDGTAWTPLTTTPVGGPDIFAANTTQLGDVALVVPKNAAPPAAQPFRFAWLPWAAGGVAIAITAVLLAATLLHRRRQQPRHR
jgi:hypothetical protein